MRSQSSSVRPILLNSIEALKMHVMQRIEKVYVYIFFVFVKSIIDEGWAVVVMTLIQSVVVMGLACSIALATGHTPISIPKVATVIGYFVIYAITRFILIRRHRWRRYEAEFEQYSKTKANWARIAVWSGVVVTILAGVDIVKTAIGAATI